MTTTRHVLLATCMVLAALLAGVQSGCRPPAAKPFTDAAAEIQTDSGSAGTQGVGGKSEETKAGQDPGWAFLQDAKSRYGNLSSGK